MPTKPLYKKLIIAGCLLVVFLLMKVTRTSFEDLWLMAKGEIAQTRADIREYRTGEYAGNVSNQLSSEAARIKSQSNGGGIAGEYAGNVANHLSSEAARIKAQQGGSGIDGELNNELAAERKRMLEERAEVARQNTDKLLNGDVEVLKRNVRDNARNAAGSY